jgi:integrase
MRIRLKFVRSWVDKKTGRIYARLRRRGLPEISLPGLPGSPEFMLAYHAALRGDDPTAAITTARRGQGTINAAVALYLDSNAFASRVPSEASRKRQASTLQNFCEIAGDNPLAALDRKYIDRVLADAPTMGVARTWLITVRPFLEWAVKQGMIESDATAGIKIKQAKSDGHHTWTDEQIAQFEARWPLGTRERLALALLIHTGQRRSDVLRMGRQHIRDGVLHLKQRKTGVECFIPVHPELAAAIAACPSEHLTFLTTARGAPIGDSEFGKWFRHATTAAGLPQSCVPHGLRKACCRRLADLGVPPHRIAAISGHLTLKEVTRYTAKYDRKQAAKEAMAVLVAGRVA